MIDNSYKASQDRYAEGKMTYRRSGNSGIKLPLLSLGFWWNFGGVDSFEESRAKIRYAFDNGITCFDLANNYGPPFGKRRRNFRPSVCPRFETLSPRIDSNHKGWI